MLIEADVLAMPKLAHNYAVYVVSLCYTVHTRLRVYRDDILDMLKLKILV